MTNLNEEEKNKLGHSFFFRTQVNPLKRKFSAHNNLLYNVQTKLQSSVYRMPHFSFNFFKLTDEYSLLLVFQFVHVWFSPCHYQLLGNFSYYKGIGDQQLYSKDGANQGNKWEKGYDSKLHFSVSSFVLVVWHLFSHEVSPIISLQVINMLGNCPERAHLYVLCRYLSPPPCVYTDRFYQHIFAYASSFR